jgi:hypothetical protein
MADIAGFAPGGSFLGEDDNTIIRELDAMHRTGARWLRMDFNWSGMEPQRGVFQTWKQDKIVKWARARNIQIIALVAYTPSWAQPGNCRQPTCGPADVWDYAHFMKKLVAHFSKFFACSSSPGTPVTTSRCVCCANAGIAMAQNTATNMDRTRLTPALSRADIPTRRPPGRRAE